jgi:hypothetical protein
MKLKSSHQITKNQSTVKIISIFNCRYQEINFLTSSKNFSGISLGAFAASELDVVFSGYQPR